MSRTLVQDSVYVYDGLYLATIFVLSYTGRLFCVIGRLNALRSSIYTSAWGASGNGGNGKRKRKAGTETGN